MTDQEDSLADYQEHRYEEVACKLDQAYLFGAHPTVLYPLAISLQFLDEYEAAEERLQRYMGEIEVEEKQRYMLRIQLQGLRRQFSHNSAIATGVVSLSFALASVASFIVWLLIEKKWHKRNRNLLNNNRSEE